MPRLHSRESEFVPKNKRQLKAVAAEQPITVEDVIAHPSQLEFEDEFETLLDEMGDSEFGAVQAASEAKRTGATLKNWTSQDFANIYTRFRPHLERYAKRWLNNPSQIDEVVQDAFLYLMVTLPELDSELGVLRFLKWKTRLLCLDVIRASGRAVLRNVDDYELASDAPESSAALEAADDAAVVRLALSKLNPRHREVLLATMYEEKSISEVAVQVELSENATRQLLFRARSAFKQALIGDTDTTGMSAAAILSVAARKAGSEIQQQGVKALVTLFVLVIAIGSYFTFTGHPSNGGTAVVAQGGSNSGTGAGTGSNSSASNETSGNGSSSNASSTLPSAATVSYHHAVPAEADNFDTSLLAPTNDDVQVNEAALRAVLNNGVTQQVTVVPNSLQGASVAGSRVYLVNCETRGCSASFRYSAKTGIQNFTFNLTVDGYDFTAYLLNPMITTDGDHLVLTGNLSDLIDAQQVVWSGTALQGATVRMQFNTAQLVNGLQDARLAVNLAN